MDCQKREKVLAVGILIRSDTYPFFEWKEPLTKWEDDENERYYDKFDELGLYNSSRSLVQHK